MILNDARLDETLSLWRNQQLSIVLVTGVFDLFHFGHLRLLGAGKLLGDRLVVAVAGDKNVRRTKGSDRPIFMATERYAILDAIVHVDLVAPYDDPVSRESMISRIDPQVLVLGDDYAGRAEPGLDGLGVQSVVHFVERDHHSTTQYVEKIRGQA